MIDDIRYFTYNNRIFSVLNEKVRTKKYICSYLFIYKKYSINHCNSSYMILYSNPTNKQILAMLFIEYMFYYILFGTYIKGRYSQNEMD